MAFSAVKIWTDIAAGTMIDLDERRYYAARIDIFGQAQAVYWTEDGTITGTALFGTKHMPMVGVIVADHTSRQAWTQDGCWGAMLQNEFLAGQGVFSWVTKFDLTNEVYFTEVYNGSPYGTGRSTGFQQQRPAWVYALGGAQVGDPI